MGIGEGAETGASVGGGTGPGVEEAGSFTDSKAEAPAGGDVSVGSAPAVGAADGEGATVGWGDTVDEGNGIAVGVGVAEDDGKMSGRINNPANIRDDPGWTRAGVGEGITGAVGGNAVTLGMVGMGMGVNPGAETGDAQAVADPTTTNQQTRVTVSP